MKVKESFIHLNGVTYRYPHREVSALEGIALDVRPGEYLLVAGASGSGKSTLFRTFNGLIPHFYGGRLMGSVLVEGRATADRIVADLFGSVALVNQNPQSQLFNRTVEQELAFGMESLGFERRRMAERIAELAAQLEIQDLLHRQPQTLSGGEQQLAAIAAALAVAPKVIVLDEPLANLDPARVVRLSEILRDLQDRGMGIVMGEHRMAATLPEAQRLVVIAGGRKAADGSPDGVLAATDGKDLGLEWPLAVQLGRRMGIAPIPRRMDDLPVVPPWPVDLPAEAAPSSSSAGPAILKAEGVSCVIDGRTIVRDVDVEILPGSCVALVGANGAGKTTLLKLLNGLLRPSRGRIRLAAQDLKTMQPHRAAAWVGTAFQNPNNQFFKLTVREELEAGPRALNRLDPQWIDELVNLFDLEELLERSPFKLSGGEKKRVAFAAAVASRPALLALDEPTAGQDGRFRRALAWAIEGLCRKGTAVLIVTHALNFAETVARKWWVMVQGAIVAQADPFTIMADDGLMRSAGLTPTERFVWYRKSQAGA